MEELKENSTIATVVGHDIAAPFDAKTSAQSPRAPPPADLILPHSSSSGAASVPA